MAGQIEFMEAIHELERIAETNGNQLTMDEIKHYFMEMELDEKQFDFICKYYESHNIVIINRVEKQEEEILDEEIATKEDPLDADMVAIYVKEAEAARSLSADEMEALARKVAAGVSEERELLIEANLAKAISIAREYKGRGMLLSDLIQECNIGLMLAVNTYEESKGSFAAYIEDAMHQQMEEALEEYNGSTKTAMKMASNVNRLNDIATAFAKENDREAKPEELAQRMGITEEEVRDLMKMSLDAISALNEGNLGDE